MDYSDATMFENSFKKVAFYEYNIYLNVRAKNQLQNCRLIVETFLFDFQPLCLHRNLCIKYVIQKRGIFPSQIMDMCTKCNAET